MDEDPDFLVLPSGVANDRNAHMRFLEEQSSRIREEMIRKRREKSKKRLKDAESNDESGGLNRSLNKLKSKSGSRRSAHEEDDDGDDDLDEEGDIDIDDLDVDDDDDDDDVIEEDEEEVVVKQQEPRKKHKQNSDGGGLEQQLLGSKFRVLNERLYSTSSRDAVRLFKETPSLFDVYHAGFAEQVSKWPYNPLQMYIDWLNEEIMPKKKQPKNLSINNNNNNKKKKVVSSHVDLNLSSLGHIPVIADFGCGEAALSASLQDAVRMRKCQIHSFDLCASGPNAHLVTPCDSAHCPLAADSVDVAVFCLSLMGTNWEDFVREAHRVLHTGAWLLITEVQSRMQGQESKFSKAVCQLGFDHVETDTSHANSNFFSRFVFKKNSTKPMKMPSPRFVMGICKYKRR